MLNLLLAAAIHCGTERWLVKTMSDPAATSVVMQPKDTTVSELTALPAPALTRATPRLPEEKTEVRLPVLFLGFKLENDEDYHIVIADQSYQVDTMIAESPNPTCAHPADPVVLQKMAKVHDFVTKCFGEPKPENRMTWFDSPVSGIVEGIIFFDFPHGQTGLAPNAIEVHPMQRIEIKACPSGWSVDANGN